MILIFYKKNSLNSFAIEPSQHDNKKETHVWLYNQDGEGGQFNSDDVTDVIYEALEKYFNEHY